MIPFAEIKIILKGDCMTKPNVIEMHDITKKFGEFVANDHINLDVRQGEIHALLGENGAGKSTLMNRLVGKKIAQTGNKPGVTKGQQWLRSGSQLELLDTPGILWPKFEDEEIGKKLALTGAIKDQLLHLDDLAIYGLEFFARFYPQRLTERYGLTEEELFLPAPEQLMLISQKRGFRDDYNRASEMIILEIRSGKLGTYTLDRWEELGDE